jgi:signal transduction histidine kinase/ligand-binding sensor domain-containing protein
MPSLRFMLGLLVSLALAGVRGSAAEYRLKAWRTEEGLPHNQVNCLAQTADGYLWVGTVNGLARFDGQRFEVYDARNQPPMETSDVVNFLLTRRHGLLFLTRDGQWCQRRDDGTFASRLELTQMTAWLEDDSGRDWCVKSPGGLFELRGGSAREVPDAAPLAGLPIVAAGRPAPAVFRAGQWWELRSDRWQPVTGLPALPPSNFAWQVQSPSGGAWFLLDRAIHRLGPDGRLQTVAVPGVTDSVSTLLSSPGGVTALVTYAGQAFRVFADRGEVELVRDPNGRPLEQVVSALPDDEGNLWLGTRNDGLIRLSESAFRLRDRRHGFPGDQLTTVAIRRAGGLWLGDRDGNLWSLDKKQIRPVLELTNKAVIQLAQEDVRGDLWVGQQAAGLHRFRDGRWADFWAPAGLDWRATHWPSAVLDTRAGDFWVASSAAVSRQTSAALELFTGQGDLIEPGGVCLAEDPAGNVWVGSYGGLSVWRAGRWETIRYGPDTFPVGVFSLLSDADGGMWIGTKGNRLSRFHAGRLTGFPLNEDSTDNAVCGLVADDQGNLWLATFRGLMRVRRSAFAECLAGRRRHLDADTFGPEDGLVAAGSFGPAQPAIVRAGDGLIHCATLRGLVSFDPAKLDRPRRRPAARIEELRLDGQARRQDGTKAVEIPAGTTRTEIRFTGIQLSEPGKVRFRYRLEGVDHDWVEAGLRRTALYGRLPAGRRVLEVMATGPDLAWPEPAAKLTLQVGAHFWETRWFATTVAVAGLAALAWLVRLVSTRRLALRLALAEHQAAVERERSRISRDMHDDLGARLTKIAFFSELAERNRDTPAATEHLHSVARMSREAAQALNEMVWAVKPANDTLTNLAGFLCQYATEYLDETPMRLRLDFPRSVPARPLTAEVRHELFLVVKEALNNVVKHARAGEVLLRLTTEPDGFAILVADDGVGLPAEGARSGGNGLANMRRRLEHVGGRCVIGPREGGGTEIRLWVPLPAAAGD